MTDVFNVTGAEGALLDAVFIHGLDGDAQTTWADDWPGWLGWLGEDLPGIAIWTVGYGAASSRWRPSPALSIVDRATNVLAALENRGIGRRPVCFVVHSMGGLVLKELLLDSAEGGINPSLASATRGVVFLATPHNGSQMAVVADRFRRVYRGTPAIVDLKRDDANLRRASSRYRQWAARSRAEHLVLFESLNLRGWRVVDEGSSDPGIPGVRPIPVDADHSHICKPASRQSIVYGQVRGLLEHALFMVRSEGADHPGGAVRDDTEVSARGRREATDADPTVRITSSPKDRGALWDSSSRELLDGLVRAIHEPEEIRACAGLSGLPLERLRHSNKPDLAWQYALELADATRDSKAFDSLLGAASRKSDAARDAVETYRRAVSHEQF